MTNIRTSRLEHNSISFLSIDRYSRGRLNKARHGRRVILYGSLILTGISLLLIISIPTNMQWLVVVLAMVGKLGIAVSIDIVYKFSTEQYPTVMRNVGVGACSTLARIGGIMVPYILYLTPMKPFIIVDSLVFGRLFEELPETIRDGEAFGNYVPIVN